MNSLIYVIILAAVLLLYLFVGFGYIRPHTEQVIGDFETRVIVAKDKKTGKVKVLAPGVSVELPVQKGAPSKQTKSNSKKANALSQCSNVSVSCFSAMERMVRDDVTTRRSGSK